MTEKSPERLFAEKHADKIIAGLHRPFVQIGVDANLMMNKAHVKMREALLSIGHDVQISKIDNELIIRRRKVVSGS